MGKSFKNILDLLSEPQTRDISEKYLNRYWLDKKEWKSYWQPLKDKIFAPESVCLPDMMFKKDFALFIFIGGVVFTEDDFKALQKCMLEAGDKWFVIAENKHTQPVIIGENGKTIVHPLLRFKFPAEITWDELLNGGLISMELFETSYKEFFVFGSSAKWGKYAANEYWDRSVDPAGTPLDIIGFKPEISSIFQKNFKQLKEEQEKIKEWLPPKYKDFIK